MATAVKRPAGETRGKVAAGPDTGQCHRASSRPYILIPEDSGVWADQVRRVALVQSEAPGR
jgi:hypothetical protein